MMFLFVVWLYLLKQKVTLITDSCLNQAGGSVDSFKEWRSVYAPTFRNVWWKHGPRGENVTFKTPRESVKRLFVEITKNKTRE